MSRVIKFRGWYKPSKKWIEEFYVSDDGTVYESGRDLEDGISSFDLELLQFTGLHDMNGKEIYEGDIVDGPYGIGFVEYGKYITDNVDNEDIQGWMTHQPLRARALDPQAGYKIIGNIYEHSDLLKL